MSNEIWKLIPNYPGYEVSNRGRVRSYRVGGNGHHIADKPRLILAQHDNHSGYKAVTLFQNGIRKVRFVHRLLLKAFVPQPSPNHQTNHIDGDKQNNNLDNLEWVTPSENIKHSFRVLGDPPHNYGEKHHASILTEVDVREIRGLYKKGNITQKEMAIQFNVHPSVISRVVNRKGWKSVL